MSYSKRQLILEKAIELFTAHGFDAVSIQDITDYCGISKGAFYLSFKSKDDLILALIEQLLLASSIVFDQSVNNKLEPQIKLYTFFEQILALMQKHSGIVYYFFHDHIHFNNKNTFLIHLLAQYQKEARYSFGQLLSSVYGDGIAPYKQDLILSLNSLFHTYFEYVCIKGLESDLKMLSQSLVEKMNILAHASYSYALPNELLLSLNDKHTFTSDELEMVRKRLVEQLSLRLTDEAQTLKHEALKQLHSLLQADEPNKVLLYALNALMNEWDEYKPLAMQLRSYIYQAHPQ